MVLAAAMLVLPAAVMVALAARAYRGAEERADGWAAERHLTLDSQNRAMVVWYLRSSRALRILGALAGFVLTTLARLAASDHGSDPGGWAWMGAVAGYLAGVVYAEVTLRRPPGHRASVRPRQLRGYLSPWAARAQRRTAAMAGLFAMAALLVPAREPGTSLPPSGVVLALVALVAGGVEAIQRWLVRRPQPVVSTSLREADDAIRRQSVHSIAGAAIGLHWLLTSLAMVVLANSDVQLLRWTMWAPALAAFWIGLVMCTRFEHGGFQVRRPERPVVPAG